MASGVFSIRQQAQAAGHGAWSGSQTTPYVDYLIVAGGGAGGGSAAYGGGGGGAGGLLQGIATITPGVPITVTVGSGGTGSVSGNGGDGNNSVFGNLIAIGGGGGANGYSAGDNGGSGGGGGTDYRCLGTIPYNPRSYGVIGQGNNGGLGNYHSAGGGGGAGSAGLISGCGAGGPGGYGGVGISSAISGTVTAYAGGGGGGATYNAGLGGAGGGGNAGNGANGSPSLTAPTAGSQYTGGGGGGSGQNYTGSSANGGSGIVIISYPDIYNAPASFGGANSPTASTSGSGSVSFNGSSQYLTWPSGSSVAFGSGNFTFECWVYLTAAPTVNFIIDFRDSGHTTAPCFLWGDVTSGVLAWDFTGAGSGISSSATWSTNTWYHIAYVRNGTTGTIYQNGVAIGTGTDSTNYSVVPTTSSIGARYASTFYYFPGYMSNLRIVKGTAVYTNSFTPPTAPLTPITNTQLLLSTVSGAQFADSSTNSYTITTTGSPTWNQASPFATGLGYKNRVYTWIGSGTVTF